MDTHCQRCQHPWTLHGPDGCIHHEAGHICECRISNDAEAYRARTPARMLELQDTVRKLDDENNERFRRETEYQNRIRTLEARVRTLEQTLEDVASYIQRRRA